MAAFPSICRANSFSSVATVASWTRPATGDEPESPLTDPGLFAFYKSNAGLTDDGTGSHLIETADCWLDQSGHGRHLSCSGLAATQRVLNDVNGKDSIYFGFGLGPGGGGVNSFSYLFMQTGTLNLTQPFSLYMLWKPNAWSPAGAFRIIVDGYPSGNHQKAFIAQDVPFGTGKIASYAGSNWSTSYLEPATGTWGITTQINDGASSVGQLNNTTEVVTLADIGAGNPGGLMFGNESSSATAGNNMEMNVAAIIVSSGHNDSTQRAKHTAWLTHYGAI